MADEVSREKTSADEACQFVKRFKVVREPLSEAGEMIIAVAVLKDHVEEHFGSQLATSVAGRWPEGSNGIRVYNGLTQDGDRRYYLAFTYEKSDNKIPEEILEEIYHVRNATFNLEEVAANNHPHIKINKKHISNHIVCQPNCPKGKSLHTMS